MQFREYESSLRLEILCEKHYFFFISIQIVQIICSDTLPAKMLNLPFILNKFHVQLLALHLAVEELCRYEMTIINCTRNLRKTTRVIIKYSLM